MRSILCLMACFFILQAMNAGNLRMEKAAYISGDSLALRYLIREPLTPSAQKKAIVLLHGVGSNEEDLFSLAGYLPEDYYIISARGKFTLSEGSYAWYQVDFSKGKPVYDPAQVMESRAAILLFLEQVQVQYGFEEIYLGGFSQGAIMSYSIGLNYPKKLKGIFCLSGRMLDEIRGEVKMNSALQKLRIFIAHGTQDRVLPIQYAREARAFLTSIELELSYHEYKMGHEVIQEELNELKQWLLNP